MRTRTYMLVVGLSAFGAACGRLNDGDPAQDSGAPGTPDGAPPGTPDGAPPSGNPDAAPPIDPTVQQLLGLVANCNQVLGGTYATDYENAPDIHICGLQGAVFWKSDMDIDCDGKRTAVCNEQTDGAYQPRTSSQDSNGQPLDASTLPYVVIPLPSNRWNYEQAGIDLGQVVAVIYKGKLEFGVFGDQGPDNIIGEASYRMAQLLGIDPDPSTGGTEGPVYFIAFTGQDARLQVIEDHDAATTLGMQEVMKLLQSN